MDGPEKTAELFDAPQGGRSEAIEKLRQHPEIISAVASAFSGGISQNEDISPESDDASTEKESSRQLGGISADKLSDIMATVGPMLSSLGVGYAKDARGSTDGNREALLCALRPYLSHERREMIDLLMRFMKIGDLLKRTK